MFRLVSILVFFPIVVFAQPGQEPALPVTGVSNAHLKSFDDLMISFVKDNKVPGASLAVTKDGKLVYSRGFGYADVEGKKPVQPNSQFRIASISKPITAVAVLQLVERGKLRLDDKVFEKISYPVVLENGEKIDERIKQITILQLLHHTAGWDRAKSFDPMFRPQLIASVVKSDSPANQVAVIRYMEGKPLDFAPGERYAYSNFGYCLLGRLIEQASGMKYEEYIRKEILAPVGVKDMKLGKTLFESRAEHEVKYYDSKNRMAQSVVGPKKQVPLPYGAWYLEAMDSHGGWIASAPDLVRFASAFDQPANSPLLKQASIETMFTRPDGLAGYDDAKKPRDSFYGCGWSVRPVGNQGKANTWHTGSLDGTSTILVRRSDGLNWAVLFNSRNNPDGQTLSAKIDPLVHKAADAVKTWPTVDLFEKK